MRSEEGLTLETSASLFLRDVNMTHINLFDTKFQWTLNRICFKPGFHVITAKSAYHLSDLATVGVGLANLRI